MVEQIDNPANKAMHYGNPNMGVLNPPDHLPKVQLYSWKEGDRIYNQMQQDLYQSSKHARPPKRHKFPMILKILFGGAFISFAIANRKNIFNFIKKPFKK